MADIPFRNLIFIPVFFAFYILFKVFAVEDFALTHFSGRSISIATAEGIDISDRVSSFYKGIAFLLFLLIAFSKLMLIIRNYIPAEELRLMNGLSLAGFTLLFFGLFGADVQPSLHVIFALLAVLTITSVFHQVDKRVKENYTVPFLWSVLMSVNIFFLQWQLLRFTAFNFFSLPVVWIIAGSVLYLLATNRFSINSRTLRATFPFMLIPFLSFLSMEFAMILNQHRIYIPQSILYSSGLLVIISLSIYIWNKYKPGSPAAEPLNILFKRWIPWMLGGIFCIAFYSPVVKVEVDIFENANNILPLHQWFNFGKLPLLDSFNAHAVSDFGAGLIYSILNGAEPMGYFVYRFLVHVVCLVLLYIMIYKMSGDGFLAIFIALIYPYADHLIPSYFNIIPLAVIAFMRLYEKQSIGRYLFLFCTFLFMLFWRIDLGISVIAAGLISFLILAFLIPSFKVNGRMLYRSVLLMTCVLFLIFISALFYSGANLFVIITDVLNYLSSVQSYGVKDLSPVMNMQYFALYFIMPSVILLIIAATVYYLRTGRLSGQSVMFGIVIIFLGVFYFSNFQRGLVRHTLYEHWNTALTSYGYFVISAFVLMLIHKSRYESRMLLFFTVTTFLISNYTINGPDLKTNNNYSALVNKVYAAPFIFTANERVNRIVHEKPAPEEIKNFLDANFPKSTFVDFSNSPMLYYYTKRVVPSYFLQIPHTAHNEYLQNRFITDLKKYDVPVAVMSNVPGNFWDNLDGIPNTLRHYRIAEYLYANYKPANIIDGRAVWIKKNNDQIKQNIIFQYTASEFNTSSERINGYYVTLDARQDLHHVITDTLPLAGNKYATVSINAKTEGDLIFHYNNSSYDDKRQTKLHYQAGENNLFIMLDKLEPQEQLTDIRITLNPYSQIRIDSITISGANMYPDLHSSQPVHSSLKWIPFIWGTYDENYKNGLIQKQQSLLGATTILTTIDVMRMNIKSQIDKQSGNYLKLRIKNTTDKNFEITVKYGSGDRINGSFSFNLKNDTADHDYLTRISSQYGWYNNENDWISVHAPESIELNSAEILKGE